MVSFLNRFRFCSLFGQANLHGSTVVQTVNGGSSKGGQELHTFSIDDSQAVIRNIKSTEIVDLFNSWRWGDGEKLSRRVCLDVILTLSLSLVVNWIMLTCLQILDEYSRLTNLDTMLGIFLSGGGDWGRTVNCRHLRVENVLTSKYPHWVHT